MKTDTPIGLTEAARIINEISGHQIDRDALRNQIIRDKWKYPSYKIGKEWSVILSDVKKYAKSYKGIKKGRPFKN